MSEPKDIPFPQVIPPARSSGRPGIKPEEFQGVTGIIAKWLDEVFHLPIGKMKIGLDPIISLFPVVGDVIVSSAGAIIMLEAVRKHAPAGVLARMGGNMLANAGINLIPFLGPAVSIFFKSNSRNFGMLQAWQAGQMDEVRRSTRRLVFGVLFLILILSLIWAALGLALFWGFKKVFGW